MFDDHDLELNIYAVFSSGNHDGITSAKKMISCFTYESRHILKSFSLFLTVRMITNWILGTAMNLNKKIRNYLARYTSPDNAEFGHFMFVVLRRTAKKCTKNYNARAQPLFFSLILLFSGVPVAVSVAVSWTPQSLSSRPVSSAGRGRCVELLGKSIVLWKCLSPHNPISIFISHFKCSQLYFDVSSSGKQQESVLVGYCESLMNCSTQPALA